MAFNIEKYQAGGSYADTKTTSDNFFADPAGVAAGLVRDFKAVRARYRPHELAPLIEDLVKKGEPLDDKKGTTEKLINILTLLPHDSKTRVKLTNKLIDTLWDNLQHPPLSYVGGDVDFSVVKNSDDDAAALTAAQDSAVFTSPQGVKLRADVPPSPNGMYQYRMPDGSYNNILNPNLGKAGTPYARSVRPEKKLHGRRPDAGLLFDMLMARGDDTFRENPAGISSILFYHATIIIHDIFRTNLKNRNISDTSSYLDLAPLYGSSLRDQLEIRTMKDGKLKPDTFHEKRLLGQPPGVNVILVLYSRFHNYVADMLLKINEGGRFTLACKPEDPPELRAKAVAKQDHDLFNTARLVVGGMYINISLHDYLRAITNTHHSASDWTLDPRVEIGKSFDSEGTPRGIGNQVSVEFNLLYRFHACISKKDEAWLNDFFLSMFPGRTKDNLSDISPMELMGALQAFEAKLSKDPSQREFGGLKRQADGRFKDEDLARLLKESIEDPAGCFGARMVPKALRVIEMLGILQARKWQVASLNEFRQFFGLKRWEKFRDISSDADIAGILEKLYDHPDMVELYPGLMIEDIKPALNPGSGICPTYSVGRAILSDAITLVRSDRFNTIDYTVGNLTSWGYEEVNSDWQTLGGSMFYKLIQRGIPGWFPYNSLHVMQPMYTPKMNEQIAKEIGTIALYAKREDGGPKKPAAITVVANYEGCRQVLEDHQRFVVPWLPALNTILPGKRDYGSFMLAGDQSRNIAQHKMMASAFQSVPNLLKVVDKFVMTMGEKLLKDAAFKMRGSLYQLDVVRDLAIPLDAQMLADLFYLDLKSPENPYGSLSHPDLYKHLINLRTWAFNNFDPALSWNRRRWAADGATALTESGKVIVQDLHDARNHQGLVTFLTNILTHKPGTRTSGIKQGSLRECGRKLIDQYLGQGMSVADIVDMQWLAAVGGVGFLESSFAEVLQFFLRPVNSKIWARVQDFAAKGDNAELRKYVLEAQRLTSTNKTVRVATAPSIVNGKPVSAGAILVTAIGEAGRDPEEVEHPAEFVPERKQKAVSPVFSGGVHACIGNEIATTFIVGLIKLMAGLRNLRQSPGDMGQLKTIKVGNDTCYLSDTWSYLSYTPSTWKLHFDGRGNGQFQGSLISAAGTMDFQQMESELQKREEQGAEKDVAKDPGLSAC